MASEAAIQSARTPRLMLPSAVIAGALLMSAVFAQRIYVPVNIGERQPGIAEILPILLVVLAAATVVASRGQILRPLLTKRFLLVWGPLLVLGIAYPVVGVAAGQFPVRGLAATRVLIVAIAAILLGAELKRRGSSSRGGWILAGATLLVLGYAVLQQLDAARILSGSAFSALRNWDISVSRDYGSGVILGRSVGFYTNPNVLGVWAGTAFLIGLFLPRGWLNYLVCGLALGTLVLSQSRGATAGLVAGLLFLLVMAVRRGRIPSMRTVFPYVALVGVVLVGWYLLSIVRTPAAGFFERFGQALGILVGSPDSNFSGRVKFWEAGIGLLRSHPLGTFGPPEVLLGSAIDSEWVRTLVQGGPLMFLALALALFGGAFSGSARGADTSALRAMSVFLAVAGLVEIPLEYPPAVLYWALVGASLVAREPVVDVREVGSQGRERRLLMVATISRTLEAFMQYHAARLKQAGWSVDGMASGISSSAVARAMFDRVVDVGWSRRPLAIRNLTGMWRARRAIRQGKYDIVHVQTPVAAFLTRLGLRSYGPDRPVIVYTAHGFHFHTGAGWLRNVVYGGLERLAGPWTDELVVVNEEDHTTALKRRLVPEGHLHLIPGVGLDVQQFQPMLVSSAQVAAMRQEQNLLNRPIILSIAELNRNKNVSYLVAGLARMRRSDAELVVIGDGPRRMSVGRLALALGVAPRVHLIAYVKDVRVFLRAAAAFALVSVREGLPVSMMEAMSMQTPVVGTDTRGIRDLVADHRGVLVPLGDPSALARALDEVLDNPDAAAERASRAREFVSSHLSVERIASDYARLYDEALGPRRRGLVA